MINHQSGLGNFESLHFFPNLALLLNKTNLNSRTYIVQPHYFVDIRIGTDFAFKINIVAFGNIARV